MNNWRQLRHVHVPVLHLGHTPLCLGPSWIVLTPACAWAVATLYVPLVGPGLGNLAAWSIGIGATVLFIACLALHGLAHLLAARLAGADRPERMTIGPFGDASQSWPVAVSPWHEAGVTIAGPIASFLMAGGLYLVWDRQLHPWLNVGLPLLLLANAVVAVLNLAPGFPLDGGRLTRALVWGLLARADRANLSATVVGWAFIGALVGWAGWLLLQPARFHTEAGLGTLVLAALLVLMRLQPGWRWTAPPPSIPMTVPARAVGLAATAGIVLVLLLLPASLLPTLDGLLAPGMAVAVEPMIRFDGPARQEHRGTFLLTSVIAQTPIIAGQWVQGRLDPAVALVPPERIVPADITPRQLAARSFNQLEDSTTLASIVALRLVGYTPQLTGDGARIASIVPESPNVDLLLPNDRVVELDGQPIGTASDLTAAVRRLAGRASVDVAIERAGQRAQLTLPLMAPARPGDPPRLGVTIETVGARADLPFPVHIEPQKIVGGPSAGLMFTLTLVNLLSTDDLTGGQRIAGTGTIDINGAVGPIGGVMQKVAAAEQAGARYFLVPNANADEARSVARQITIVPVGTAQEAIAFLRREVASLPG